MIITLEGEKCPSWNTFYSGKHWTKRKEEVDRVHMLVRSQIDPDLKQIGVPVNIRVTAFYADKRKRDSDNIAAKLYIDGLKPFVIPEDDYHHVHDVTTRAKHDPSGDKVVIEVIPIF